MENVSETAQVKSMFRLILFGGLAYPLWGSIYYFVYPDLALQLSVRFMVMGGLVLAATMANLFRKPHYIRYLFLATIYFINIHIMYLTHLNHYDMFSILGAVLSFFCVTTILNSKKDFFLFSIINIFLASTALYFAPLSSSLTYLLSVITVLCLNIISFVNREKLNKKIYEMSTFYLANINPVMRLSVRGELLMNNPAAEVLLPYWGGRQGEMNQTWKNRLKYIYEKMEKKIIQIEFHSRQYRLAVVPVKGFNYLNIYAEDITEDIQLMRTIAMQKSMLQSNARFNELGVMAASIAHEINNPLAVISGRARQIVRELQKVIIDSESRRDKINHAAGSIMSTVDRVTKIIRALSALSKDGSKDEQHPVLLSEVIETTMEFSRTRVVTSGVKLNISCNSRSWVNGSAVQLSQVLINLVNNAHDAVAELKDPWVDVCVYDEANYVVIKVMDSGKGISKSLQERLFQPFFTTKDVNSGTGLGLSLSRDIVIEHGGSLEIDNNCPNTCFVVKLPVFAGENYQLITDKNIAA